MDNVIDGRVENVVDEEPLGNGEAELFQKALRGELTYEGELTADQLTLLRMERGQLRKQITVYYKQVQRGAHLRVAQPKTLAEIDAWGDRLDNYDATLEDDSEDAEEYRRKLRVIGLQLNEDLLASQFGQRASLSSFALPLASSTVLPSATGSSIPSVPNLSALLGGSSGQSPNSSLNQNTVANSTQPANVLAASISTATGSTTSATIVTQSTSTTATSTIQGSNQQLGGPQLIHPRNQVQQQILQIRPIDSKVTPFDGTFGDYLRFENAFNTKYGSNPSATGFDLFLKFVELTGVHGRDFTANQPIDINGLAEAQRLMREHYNNPTKIRADVRRTIDKLPKVVQDRTNPLRILDKGQASRNIIVCQTAVRRLKECGTAQQYLDEEFYRLIVQKMPYAYVTDYVRLQRSAQSTEQLVNYCKERLQEEEMVDEVVDITPSPPSRPPINRGRAQLNAVGGTQPLNQSPSRDRQCRLCSGHHPTFRCRTGTASSRANVATRKQLCPRCLLGGHQLTGCQSQYRCPCGSTAHSSVICTDFENRRQANSSSSQQQSNNNNGSNGSNSSSNNNGSNNQQTATGSPSNSSSTQASISGQMASVLGETAHEEATNYETSIKSPVNIPSGFYSQTVLVKVNGETVRALLDSGAQPTVILKSLADRLKLKSSSASLSVTSPLDPNHHQHVGERVTAKVQSLNGRQSLCIDFYPVETIGFQSSSLPPAVISSLRKSGYKLNHTSGESMNAYPVAMIIGGRYQGQLFKGRGPRDIAPGFNITRSVFGDVVMGHVYAQSQESASISTIVTELQQREYETMTTESPVFDSDQHEAEIYIRDYIKSKVKRIDGRYEVRMPWIEPVKLADNYNVARKRLSNLTTSLHKRGLYEDYNKTLQEYINNFAEPVPDQQSAGVVFYLPHHAVYRPEKTTSKTRVVFDGASHAPGEQPINSALFKGFIPWSAQDAFTRFRLGETAVIADISKAYLMIGLHPDDRDCTRFLWYGENGEIKEYRFTRVPFGLSSSPFQLAAVMKHHFNLYRSEYSDVIPLIEDNFYVDDLLLALPSSTNIDLSRFRTRVEELFRLGGFEICKWATNDPNFRELWSPEATEVKSLGHIWNLINDTIRPVANVEIPKSPELITKRSLSSFLAGIYDLSGIVLPYVVHLRLELRRLWQLGVDWDDVLPDEVSARIKEAMTESINIERAAVPRNVISEEDCHLVVFSDASKDAVGAVAYCRTASSSKLIMAKTSLSNQADIPKAELDGLFIAARLAKYLKRFYDFKSISIYSDSKINLDRLMQHPNDMKPAQAIRIARLKRTVDATYIHVTSQNNSADILSRGCTLTKLLDTPIWRQPKFEKSSVFQQAITGQIFSLEASDGENGSTPTNDDNHHCKCRPFKDFSELYQHFRAAASKLQQSLASEDEGNEEVAGYGTADVDGLTWQLIVQQSQRNHFPSEIQNIKQGKAVTRQSRLLHYVCFVDSDGLLRLSTRLQNHASLTRDEIYPMILDNHCNITKLIIEHFHDLTFHSGVSRTMTAVREKFFILRSKHAVKSVVAKCQLCRRERGTRQNQLFGQLPSFRLTENIAPFTFTGVDLFGPICVNAEIPYKRCGIIFVCAVTRAIHIELVTDQTADQFLLALRRFMARRGVPEKLYSDNGSQLVKTRKQLLHFFNQIKEQHPEIEIRLQEWMLQVPGAPWRGGFYERLIGSVKRALKSVIYRRPKRAKRDINDAELQTVLSEIEARINDRPLFTTTNEDGETVTVSPSCFLRGRRLSTIPSIGIRGFTDLERPDLIDSYLKNARLVNGLWHSFRSHYLKELRSLHQNYRRPGANFNYRPGDVVLVTSNLPREDWPTAVIEDLFKSPDGVVRTAAVRMKLHGTEQISHRDTKNLLPLELAGENTQAHELAPDAPSPAIEADK